jgi:hypothetical protein
MTRSLTAAITMTRQTESQAAAQKQSFNSFGKNLDNSTV